MRRRRRLSEEGGAVLILVATVLPVLILFGIFVIDIGNWWVHKRHLQVQADAAALAGAREFTFPACSDLRIEEAAIHYSGGNDPDHPTIAPQHNAQLGGTPPEEVHTEVNEPRPFGRPTADEPYPDEPELAGSPGPCTSGMVDVKMTETDLPWFLENTGIVEWIDAQARVELKRLVSQAGLLPLGVEEVSPQRVKVWVYDEDTGVEIASADLWQRFETTEDGKKVPYSEDGLLIYDNSIVNADAAGNPVVPLTIDMREEVIGGQVVKKQRLGLKVALSGSTSTVCGQPLVLCYGSGTDGLTRIRGYNPSASQPRLGEVNLLKSVCAGNNFGKHDNGYFSTTCSEQQIKVQLPGLSSDPLDGATVTATVQWKKNVRKVNLTYVSADDRWVGLLPVDPMGGGTRKIDINWEQLLGCPGVSPCAGVHPNVHKLFSGSRPVSGPIRELRVDVEGIENVNNVPRCGPTESCPATFTFRVGTAGRLALAKPGDDPIGLRVFGDGSTNQSLDCDPNVQGLDEEIASGCQSEYKRNAGNPCPNQVPALWGSPQPWECVALQTGTDANAPARGLNERILCRPPNSEGNCAKFGKPTACTNPNRWPNWPKGDSRWLTWEGIQDGDPRVLPLFLVPFGTFDSQGSGTVPVLDFASFYVTGWTSNGAGFENPCKNDPLLPDVFVPGTEKDSGVMSGHFMKHVNANVGGTGDGACDLSTVSACVAVMTK